MKKCVLMLCCIFVLSTVLLGCGSTVKMDETGNASITSEWYLVEFTVNGTTTRPSDEPFLVRLFTAGMNPAFSCRDGKNCTFRNGKKSHNGTVTEEGGEYTIIYDDTSKPMKGRIDGNQLTLTNEKGTLEFIFETGK